MCKLWTTYPKKNIATSTQECSTEKQEFWSKRDDLQIANREKTTLDQNKRKAVMLH